MLCFSLASTQSNPPVSQLERNILTSDAYVTAYEKAAPAERRITEKAVDRAFQHNSKVKSKVKAEFLEKMRADYKSSKKAKTEREKSAADESDSDESDAKPSKTPAEKKKKAAAKKRAAARKKAAKHNAPSATAKSKKTKDDDNVEGEHIVFVPAKRGRSKSPAAGRDHK